MWGLDSWLLCSCEHWGTSLNGNQACKASLCNWYKRRDLGVGLPSGCLGVVLRVRVVDSSTLVADSRLAPTFYGHTMTHPLILMASVWGGHLADEGNTTLKNSAHESQSLSLALHWNSIRCQRRPLYRCLKLVWHDLKPRSKLTF